MGEPNISLAYKALYTEVARRTGETIDSAKTDVDLGYADFLRSWPWSFTCPVATLAVTAAAATTDLPDNFAELIEWPSYPASSGHGRFIQQVPTRTILDMFAEASETGYPRMFALEPKLFVNVTGQRWSLRWYPTPSADVTLTYTYRVIVPKMAGDADYPAGGPMHNLTILYAALAQREVRRNDVSGAYRGMFKEELLKSIQFDSRMQAGRVLGVLSTGPMAQKEFELGEMTET